MTGSITLDDFDIVRDTNGNLVIRDDTDTTIATYDNTADEWQFADSVTLPDVTLNDTATSPTTAGEFRLNGTDIEAYTGGGVKNLSNIGSGGGGAGDVATVTVAASDSSYSADYVCDGTNDHTTINNAIGSLPATGGSVILTEGTYNLGGAVTDQGISNVLLQGQGWSTHLLLDGGVTDNVLETIGVDNWTVKDLRLDGNGANQSDGGDDFDQSGWFADNCDNLHLDGATVRNTIMSNVRWVAQDGGTHTDYRITDSWLHNTIGSDGSTASPDGYSITVRNGSTIQRAHCSDSLITECSHQSIEWVGISKGIITGTIIYSTKPETASNGVMTGMNIHSTTAGTTSNIVISGNYVEVPNADATQIAATGPDMTVTGNTAVGGSSNGITVDGPQNAHSGATVTGNTCINNEEGVWVNVPYSTVVGNTTEGQSKSGVTVTTNANNSIVVANTSEGAGDHGILVEGSGCAVGFNQARGSTNADISDTGSNNMVRWNQTSDGSGRGVYVQSTTPSNPSANDLWFDTS